MKQLSELLQFYLKTRNINISEAARICNMDRANMHKIFYGKRKLTSPEIAGKLAVYMKLSPLEEAEFINSFYYSLDGYEIYKKRYDVEDFFTNIETNAAFYSNHFPRITIDDVSEEMPPVSSFSSLQRVQYAVLWVIMKELTQPEPRIRFISPAEKNDLVLNTLKSCIGGNSSAEIRHIFSMNGQPQEGAEYDSYNFHCLMSVFALCVEADNYEPYYYYTSRKSASQKSPIPLYAGFLATSEYMLEFSQDYLYAIMIRDKNVLDTNTNRFDTYIKNTRLFVKMHRTLQEQLSSVHAFTKENTSIFHFNMEPCLVSFFTQEIIMRSINPAVLESPLMDVLSKQYFGQDVDEFADKVVWYVISEDGVRRFLETGILSEFPDELYTPLPKEDRLYLLRMYIQKMAKKTLLLYQDLYDNARFVTFYAGDKSCLLYYRKDDGRLYNLYFNESCILSVFRSFAENLPQNKYYPKEETAERLKMILHEYE